MPMQSLFVRMTLYYAAVTGLVLLLLQLAPVVGEYLPIGGADALLNEGADADPLQGVEIAAQRATNLHTSLIWLFLASIGTILTALPVAWTYMACRDRSQYDQSLVETMLVLPVIVCGIVIVVHNSLALAFSLAGIVGGVGFRNKLKSPGDTLYIFVAISIGLSGGIGALEIALVTSIMFNYLFLALWAFDFGAVIGGRRFLRDRDEGDPLAEPEDDEAPPPML